MVCIKVDPAMMGCPQQVNPTVNRLPPADKASIHSRPSPPLLVEGPAGELREATVSATVSEMDEGGNPNRGRV